MYFIEHNKPEIDSSHIENSKVFKALCDPKRLIILKMLRQGEQCACDLIDGTGIAQSAISYHMKILLESTLVDSWQVGKWTYYKISETGKEQASILLKNLLETNLITADNHCE